MLRFVPARHRPPDQQAAALEALEHALAVGHQPIAHDDLRALAERHPADLAGALERRPAPVDPDDPGDELSGEPGRPRLLGSVPVEAERGQRMGALVVLVRWRHLREHTTAVARPGPQRSTRPVRTRRESAGRRGQGVDLGDLVGGEDPRGGRGVGPDLCRGGRPGDHRGHHRLGRHPGQGQFEHGVAPLGSPGRRSVDDVEFRSENNPPAGLAEVDEAGPGRSTLTPGVLARQQPAGQRVEGR